MTRTALSAGCENFIVSHSQQDFWAFLKQTDLEPFLRAPDGPSALADVQWPSEPFQPLARRTSAAIHATAEVVPAVLVLSLKS